jgi:hypothetical protein
VDLAEKLVMRPIGALVPYASNSKPSGSPIASYEGKFETYLHERENAKKPRAVRLSRPQFTRINCSAARRA